MAENGRKMTKMAQIYKLFRAYILLRGFATFTK